MVRVGKSSSCVALELCLIRNGAKILLKFPYNFMKILFRFKYPWVIRMSHWHQQMVDGTGFWISCTWLKALRKASQSQLSYSDFERKRCSARSDGVVVAQWSWLHKNHGLYGRLLVDIKGKFSWTKWLNSCGYFWVTFQGHLWWIFLGSLRAGRAIKKNSFLLTYSWKYIRWYLVKSP